MKELIFAGDSHTGVFGPFSDEILAIYSGSALTMDSFSRGRSDAYWDLVTFLNSINIKDCSLILCMSEVDVRVHFWRDMPVLEARGMGFDEFLQEKVDNFVKRVASFAQQMGFSRIILWGAPASQLTNHNHTEELPATGDNITRNILTHMLNTRIIQAIATSPTPLRFATPFYGMISEDFVTNTSLLRDGVHLNSNLRDYCLQLIRPLVEDAAIATFSQLMYTFKDVSFVYKSISRELPEVNTSTLFRTWIQGGGGSDISIRNKFGEFFLAKPQIEDGSRVGYKELVLRRMES